MKEINNKNTIKNKEYAQQKKDLLIERLRKQQSTIDNNANNANKENTTVEHSKNTERALINKLKKQITQLKKENKQLLNERVKNDNKTNKKDKRLKDTLNNLTMENKQLKDTIKNMEKDTSILNDKYTKLSNEYFSAVKGLKSKDSIISKRDDTIKRLKDTLNNTKRYNRNLVKKYNNLQLKDKENSGRIVIGNRALPNRLTTFKEYKENVGVFKELKARTVYLDNLVKELTDVNVDYEQYITNKVFSGLNSYNRLEMFDKNTIMNYMNSIINSEQPLNTDLLMIMGQSIDRRINKIIDYDMTDYEENENVIFGTLIVNDDNVLPMEKTVNNKVYTNAYNEHTFAMKTLDNKVFSVYLPLGLAKYLKDGVAVSAYNQDNEYFVSRGYSTPEFIKQGVAPNYTESGEKDKSNELLLPDFIENVTVVKGKRLMIIGSQQAKGLQRILSGLGATVEYILDSKKYSKEINKAIKNNSYDMVIVDKSHSSHESVRMARENLRDNVRIVNRGYSTMETLSMIYHYFNSINSQK